MVLTIGPNAEKILKDLINYNTKERNKMTHTIVNEDAFLKDLGLEKDVNGELKVLPSPVKKEEITKKLEENTIKEEKKASDAKKAPVGVVVQTKEQVNPL